MDYDAAFSLIEPFEGTVPWMYLDTNGYATVGIGNLLDTLETAQALPFSRRGSQIAATSEEIATDYRSVVAAPKGRLERAYKQLTRLDLPADSIRSLFNRRIDEFVAQLDKAYLGYGGFPEPAQLAILDMAFNLGVGALEHRWPHFSTAVRAQDWAVAAQESHRPKAQTSRNSATQALFLSVT